MTKKPTKKVEEQEEDDVEYTVEAITDYRIYKPANSKRSVEQWNVKWKDFGEEENTWEPMANLENLEQRLHEQIEEAKKTYQKTHEKAAASSAAKSPSSAPPRPQNSASKNEKKRSNSTIASEDSTETAPSSKRPKNMASAETTPAARTLKVPRKVVVAKEATPKEDGKAKTNSANGEVEDSARVTHMRESSGGLQVEIQTEKETKWMPVMDARHQFAQPMLNYLLTRVRFRKPPVPGTPSA